MITAEEPYTNSVCFATSTSPLSLSPNHAFVLFRHLDVQVEYNTTGNYHNDAEVEMKRVKREREKNGVHSS